MPGRSGLGKALVVGAPVVVVALAGILLASHTEDNRGGVPFPGRPPTTSRPIPFDFPTVGPTADPEFTLADLADRLAETDRIGDRWGAADLPTRGVSGGPVEFTVSNVRLDNVAPEFDGDGGGLRSEIDATTRDTTGSLAAVLFAALVFRACTGRDRDRRVRTAARPAAGVSPRLRRNCHLGTPERPAGRSVRLGRSTGDDCRATLAGAIESSRSPFLRWGSQLATEPTGDPADRRGLGGVLVVGQGAEGRQLLPGGRRRGGEVGG